MSLPPATKDISLKPAKGSVVDPINSNLKDADVDRKLRFLGVVEAFRQGRMPSNAQIDQTLDYVLTHSPVELDKLSPEGRRLIQDTREIIHTAKVMVDKKNGDELFQNFVWTTRDTDFDRMKKDPSELTPVDKEKAASDGRQALQHLRTLLSLILTNAEARKLFADFGIIGRDLLARGAAKAAGALAPDQERLARTDEPAPPDTFHTAGGKTMGPNEGTPVPEVRIPGTDTRVAQHPKDPVGSIPTNAAQARDALNDPSGYAGAHATVTAGDGQQRRGADAMAETRDRAQDKSAQAADQARSHADDLQDATGGVPQTDEEKEAGKRTIMDKMRGFRDNLLDRVPDEHKDRARDQKDRALEFLTEEYFPEERRDQFIYRMKKVILECQKHDDYRQSIQWLIGYIEEYARHGKTVAGKGKETHDAARGDDSLNDAGRQLRTLLERFANGKSMGTIWDSAEVMINDAREDQELREWWNSVDAFIRRVLLEPGFVLDQACNDEANALRESGRRFYDDKYKAHFDNFFNSIGDFFTAMGDDPLNRRFGDDWARLTRDLFLDSEGNLKFKSELWNDIRKVILPTIIDHIGHVPIPRVEYSDDSTDLIIENLTLSGRNLFPNLVTVDAHNHISFSPYAAINDESHHAFTLTLAQIQADMRDVAFWFRRKSGFPKLTDSGLADVVLGGSGLTVTARLADAGKDSSSVFKVESVHAKVDTLQFAIRDSKHDFLYKTLKPLATGLVKKQIQKAVEGALRTGLEYIDGQLVGIRTRLADAKANDETSRRQVLQELFQKKKDEAESVKSETQSRFAVVTKRESSMLPGKGSPAGWINRVDERQEIAARGEGWKSDAFTIVGPGSSAGVSAHASGAGAAGPAPPAGTGNAKQARM